MSRGARKCKRATTSAEAKAGGQAELAPGSQLGGVEVTTRCGEIGVRRVDARYGHCGLGDRAANPRGWLLGDPALTKAGGMSPFWPGWRSGRQTADNVVKPCQLYVGA